MSEWHTTGWDKIRDGRVLNGLVPNDVTGGYGVRKFRFIGDDIEYLDGGPDVSDRYRCRLTPMAWSDAVPDVMPDWAEIDPWSKHKEMLGYE